MVWPTLCEALLHGRPVLSLGVAVHLPVVAPQVARAGRAQVAGVALGRRGRGQAWGQAGGAGREYAFAADLPKNLQGNILGLY